MPGGSDTGRPAETQANGTHGWSMKPTVREWRVTLSGPRGNFRAEVLVTKGFQRFWCSLEEAKDRFPDAVQEYANSHSELRDEYLWSAAFDGDATNPKPGKIAVLPAKLARAVLGNDAVGSDASCLTLAVCEQGGTPVPPKWPAPDVLGQNIGIQPSMTIGVGPGVAPVEPVQKAAVKECQDDNRKMAVLSKPYRSVPTKEEVSVTEMDEESHLIEAYYGGLADRDVEHLWVEIDQVEKTMAAEDKCFNQLVDAYYDNSEMAAAGKTMAMESKHFERKGKGVPAKASPGVAFGEEEQIPMMLCKTSGNDEVTESRVHAVKGIGKAKGDDGSGST